MKETNQASVLPMAKRGEERNALAPLRAARRLAAFRSLDSPIRALLAQAAPPMPLHERVKAAIRFQETSFGDMDVFAPTLREEDRWSLISGSEPISIVFASGAPGDR